MNNNLKDQVSTNQMLEALFLANIQDETNTMLSFKKRTGQTSYGFLIPEDLAPDVLENIDTITKEVKQKLLQDQSGITINTY
jgi:hypothetical protein